MAEEARRYFERIEELGGMLPAIDRGFFRREIADAAFAYQREFDAGHKLVVGVNAFQQADEKPLDILQIDLAVEGEQCESLKRVKGERSQADLQRTLDAVRRAAEAEENVLPTLIDAARARATVGETMHALADVYGRCDTAVV